jgi:ubiquinone/menaquinone biosynthesis C-methylase UbiE
MGDFKDIDVPQGFLDPTALPQNPEERNRWQDANRSWWEKHPMRYDFGEKIDSQEFSKEFYQEIDQRFFSNAKVYMPWRKIPFDHLIDFDSLNDKDVLEIGVGNGSHAQLLAQHARSYSGIDLTDYAVRSTSERMRCFALHAIILQMDAECMQFADNSFDFIWTWGVIHHSSNTRKILQEMHRVLRPGGRAITMVYHRNLWNYVVVAGLFHGVLQGDLLKTRSLHKTRQRWIDGAIARFYSIPEWRSLVSEFFSVDNILIFGSKTEIVPLPRGVIKQAALRLIPNSLSRFLTNHCKLGTFLVSTLKKTV